MTELKDAVVTAGYRCPHWDEDDEVALAAESGTCSDSDVLATYATDSDLQDQVHQFKANNKMLEDHGLDASPVLIGPNWSVLLDNDYALQDLQRGMGGNILH